MNYFNELTINKLMYKTLILITAFLVNINVSSQTETLTIQSKILNTDRKVMVSLPPSYNPNENYPLILMTDASYYFNIVKEAVHTLFQDGFPKMIVVGVLSDDRYKDLSPTQTDESSTSGGSEEFLKFLKSELIPEIRNKYSISNYHVLIGHSLGGLFTVTTSLKEPEMFDAFIASTPTIRWDNFLLLNELDENYFKQLTNKKFFLSIGNETGNEREGVLSFNKKSLKHNQNRENFIFQSYPNESHTTVPWISYWKGLKYIFAPFNPDNYEGMSLKELINYYQKLGDDYDYDSRVPQRMLLNIGSNALEKEQYDVSIEVFEYYAKHYSYIPIPYRFLGDTYFNMKKFDKAKTYYESAYKLFPAEYTKSKLKEIEDKRE